MAETEQRCVDAIISNDYADFIVQYNGDTSIFPEVYKTDCYQVVNFRFAIAHVPRTNDINVTPGRFGYSSFPNCYGIMDTSSMEKSGITRIQRQPVLSLRGKGILFGMVDTGIEYTNPIFQYEDHTTRIISIWDQTITSDNKPEGIDYGTEYTEADINNALQNPNPYSVVPSRDDHGHGTFLFGIGAGGMDAENDFIGAAPDSELVVVKLKQAKPYIREFYRIKQDALAFQESDIMQGIRYLIDIARRERKPIVICIGLGTNQGGHDGRDALSEYINTMADARGVAIVIALGNEGQSGHHYYGLGTTNGDYETVELKVGKDEEGFTMELWGDAPNIFSIGIQSPGGESIARIPPKLGERVEVRLLLEETIINIDYQISEIGTGDELIIIRFSRPTEGIWKILVYEEGLSEASFHIWLPIIDFLSEETFFVRSNPDTTLTTPGSAFIPIAVNAYNHYNNSLYIRASRGYTRSNIVKPELAAPGVNVYGPLLGGTYGTHSGSSIAAAHVAGASALLLEWGIIRGNAVNMDSIEIKKYLIRGAIRNPRFTYPNREWGYGTLDLYNTFLSLRNASEL